MKRLLLDPARAVPLLVRLTVLLLVAAPVLALLLELGHVPVTEALMIPLLIRSVGIATLVALAAVGLGGVLAWLVFRVSIRRKMLWAAVMVTPLFVPGYIHALVWKGLVPSLRGMGGVVWVSALSLYGWAFLLLGVSLESWGRSQAGQAARLHLTPVAAARVEARFHAPALGLATVVVFVLALSQFAVPDYFGVRVYATEVFARVAGYLDAASAIALSGPVLAVGLFALLLLAVYSRRTTMGLQGVAGAESRPLSEGGHIAEAAVAAVALATVGLPLGHLAYRSGGVSAITEAAIMAAPDTANGIALAGLCAVVGVCLAWMGMYTGGAQGQPLRAAIRGGALAVFMFPGAVVALGAITLWNRPGWMEEVYLSGGALVLALVARWLWLAMESCNLMWRRFSRVQEEAGHACGMRWWRTLWYVSLPQQKSMLAVAGLLVFVFVFNDLGLMVLLAPPGMSTLPLRVFSTAHYGPDSTLAALCVWQMIVLLAPVALLLWLGTGIWRKRCAGPVVADRLH